MTEDLTEAEVMGRAPPGRVFVGYAPDNTKMTFGTIGAWQAFMDESIRQFSGFPVLLRNFFDLNEDTMNDLGQQPDFAKAVGVIRAQFTAALGEG